MTYQITILRGSSRFSYYGVFPDAIEASTSAVRAALPGDRVAVKPRKKRPACVSCGTFFAEPGLAICKPCIDTTNEIRREEYERGEIESAQSVAHNIGESR
jgi:hypothetical protein